MLNMNKEEIEQEQNKGLIARILGGTPTILQKVFFILMAFSLILWPLGCYVSIFFFDAPVRSDVDKICRYGMLITIYLYPIYLFPLLRFMFQLSKNLRATWLYYLCPIDIDHQDKMGWTPLHFCAQYNNITIAELLLQEGANVNIIDCYGNNPLWYAVFNANDDYCLVKLLVKYGADALSKNNAMRSPLDFAKQIEDTEMINILANKNLISKYQSKK